MNNPSVTTALEAFTERREKKKKALEEAAALQAVIDKKAKEKGGIV